MIVGSIGLHAFGQKPTAAPSESSAASEAERSRRTPEAAPRAVGEQTARSASLVGRVLYDGPPPERPPLITSLTRQVHDGRGGLREVKWPAARGVAELGLKDESLVVAADGGIANVFVWLRSRWLPPVTPPKLLPPVRILALPGRFEPHARAFWSVRRVEWVNEMDEATTFKWEPLGAPGVNPLIQAHERGQYVYGDARQQSIPVPLTSQLQPWMRAYLLPIGHPYFAVTDEDGRFEIPTLPQGKWEFVMWHERAGWLGSDRFPDGRFTLRIERDRIELGDVRVAPQTLSGPPVRARPVPVQAVAVNRSTLADLSPLQQAAMAGDTARVRELLDDGMWVDAHGKELRGTPLQYAATKGHGEIVQLLLERGAEVGARDQNERTSLIWAALYGHADVIRRLLDAGANVNAKDYSGWTALDYAAATPKYVEARRLLIARGGKTRQQLPKPGRPGPSRAPSKRQ
ncbi:MAG: ankyrin repeat domain-containing protein [Planctomycetia bacterium]|nr:ankyrin repeat domain-containing protein [Planctomycetia bacterium]